MKEIITNTAINLNVMVFQFYYCLSNWDLGENTNVFVHKRNETF